MQTCGTAIHDLIIKLWQNVSCEPWPSWSHSLQSEKDGKEDLNYCFSFFLSFKGWVGAHAWWSLINLGSVHKWRQPIFGTFHPPPLSNSIGVGGGNFKLKVFRKKHKHFTDSWTLSYVKCMNIHVICICLSVGYVHTYIYTSNIHYTESQLTRSLHYIQEYECAYSCLLFRVLCIMTEEW